MRLARYEQCTKEIFYWSNPFLGNVLGPKYEVVFHSFDKNKAHMEAIANSHVSGRTLSSPLTLLLQVCCRIKCI